MHCSRRTFVTAMAAGTAGVALTAVGGCSSGSSGSTVTGSLTFDMSAWNYDSDNDVWWQVGAYYCTSPQLADYESMGLYVPGAYMTGTANSDGETYTCEVDSSGTAGDFTAATAPIVIPVNTAGYAAQAAPTSYNYSSVSAYIEEGFIYAYPGCRGRDNGESDDGSISYAGGAPWGVTDLKAAVRYLRYNAASLPGNMDAIFTFGHSGGGAQSSLMGATGDSELYKPYLEEIGAALEDADGVEISDAIAGAMCWCPITCLDEADAGYEWMMGQFASTGTRADGTFTAVLSQDLAAAYAGLINQMGFESDGEALLLEESSDGIYMAGTYADKVLATIEESLNNFLSDTEFPYTPSSTTMADGGFGGGLAGGDESGDLPSGDLEDLDSSELPSDGSADVDVSEIPSGDISDDATDASGALVIPDGDLEDLEDLEDLDSSELPSGDLPDGDMADLEDLDTSELPDDAADGATDSTEETESTTYETAQEYIDSLNADEEWITYDSSTNTATVASIGAFARICKAPSKDVGAFDALDRSQAENKVFSDGTSEGLHFDATMVELLSANASTYAEYEDWDSTYPTEYESDLSSTDSIGLTVEERRDLYNPLYYVLASSSGYGSSVPAPHWRIRTGIEQSDTSVTTELNLALALEANADVSDVDFATVWGQGHTTAERTGDSDSNFIEWVKSCL